ncbi:hypothetical protein [Planosporangium mesophilum]|uniref:hypothetical protein n=1 Tax=Planosporangium mesophilum TaxID=689768 RepID=UPI001439C0D9|nr:hypothetical protein [Planosporangium mesophilum]NJC86607.1 hypothetical protein [Planosporangium mesophilum]
MTTRTYLSSGVLEQLDRAQEELDRHLLVTPGGSCRACGHEEPCQGRLAAMQTFARYGQLPRRTPGSAGRTLLGRA